MILMQSKAIAHCSSRDSVSDVELETWLSDISWFLSAISQGSGIFTPYCTRSRKALPLGLLMDLGKLDTHGQRSQTEEQPRT